MLNEEAWLPLYMNIEEFVYDLRRVPPVYVYIYDVSSVVKRLTTNYESSTISLLLFRKRKVYSASEFLEELMILISHRPKPLGVEILIIIVLRIV